VLPIAFGFSAEQVSLPVDYSAWSDHFFCFLILFRALNILFLTSAMLSILIPIYNFSIVELVREIHRQAIGSGVIFEILCVDDGSGLSYREENRIVSQWKNVRYEELTENTGRARIRNRMSRMARFPWLLFLDCDSRIVRRDYIISYIARCEKEAVICGGRTYADERPENPAYYLRWYYGRRREQKSAASRSHRPWNSFMTNNFAIARSIFDRVSFDESIDKYGHEDTFFGFELRRTGIPIIHIDNPLVHEGLETNAEFIEKTGEGVHNLTMLMHRKTEYRKEMIAGIKLIRHFSWLKRFHLMRLYDHIFNRIKKQMHANLMGRNPSLLLFDMYKLGMMTENERTYNQNGKNSPGFDII
jgi:glycosyltransferase involved in cell wall biosynthesis